MAKTDEGGDPVTVLETGDPGLLAVAKSLLDEAGIQYFAKGEAVQDLFGLGRFGSGFNVLTGPIQLQVPSSDAEEAKRLLQDLSS